MQDGHEEQMCFAHVQHSAQSVLSFQRNYTLLEREMHFSIVAGEG